MGANTANVAVQNAQPAGGRLRNCRGKNLVLGHESAFLPPDVEERIGCPERPRL